MPLCVNYVRTGGEIIVPVGDVLFSRGGWLGPQHSVSLSAIVLVHIIMRTELHSETLN